MKKIAMILAVAFFALTVNAQTPASKQEAPKKEEKKEMKKEEKKEMKKEEKKEMKETKEMKEAPKK